MTDQIHRAILFRYHDHFDVCAERIALLRHYNPSLPIYGLYGGSEEQAPDSLTLDHDYKAPFPEARFKWEHGDLCIRQWYIDVGHQFHFDMLHVIEWDLVLLASLELLLGHVCDGIALTNMETLAHHKAHGWGWISQPERQEQFKKLQAFIAEKHGVRIDETLRAGPFGGACFSRAFLERYAENDIPLLLHDEIRPSAFATAYGLPVHETGLAANAAFWNCEKNYYDPKQALASGGVVFHPIKELLGFSTN